MPKGARGKKYGIHSGLSFLWISFLVFMLDWVSKELANTYLHLYNPVAFIPFFNLTLAYNTGAAFSFLNNAALWPNILFGIIALSMSFVILVWLYRLPRHEKLMNMGLSLILGGAVGNLWDRIHYKHVIDFIDLYILNWHWPVFNVADMAVSMGALLVIWRWIFMDKGD